MKKTIIAAAICAVSFSVNAATTEEVRAAWEAYIDAVIDAARNDGLNEHEAGINREDYFDQFLRPKIVPFWRVRNPSFPEYTVEGEQSNASKVYNSPAAYWVHGTDGGAMSVQKYYKDPVSAAMDNQPQGVEFNLCNQLQEKCMLPPKPGNEFDEQKSNPIPWFDTAPLSDILAIMALDQDDILDIWRYIESDERWHPTWWAVFLKPHDSAGCQEIEPYGEMEWVIDVSEYDEVTLFIDAARLVNVDDSGTYATNNGRPDGKYDITTSMTSNIVPTCSVLSNNRKTCRAAITYQTLKDIMPVGSDLPSGEIFWRLAGTAVENNPQNLGTNSAVGCTRFLFEF